MIFHCACESVCVCVCVCIPHLHYSIHLLMHAWVASMSLLLWIMLLWSLVCMYLSELALSFSSDICPGLGLLVIWLPIFNFLRSLHALFHGAVPICLLTNSIRGFPFLYIFASTCCLWSFYDVHSDKHGVTSCCGF